MMTTYSHKTLISLTFMALYGCGNKSNTSTPPNVSTDTTTNPGDIAIETGTIDMNVRTLSTASAFAAANSKDAAAVASVASAGSLAIDASLDFSLLTADDTWPSYKSNSIAAGPPDGFKLVIKKITLSTAKKATLGDATATNVGASTATNTSTTPSQPVSKDFAVLFDKPNGVTVSVDSGTLDLGELTGAGSSFKVPVGTYDKLTLTLRRRAEIKGCVTGDFNADASGANALGSHTYCTRAGYSQFDKVTSTNADFENIKPDWMGIDINLTNAASDGPDDSKDITFPLSIPLKITKDSKVDLSLVMDLNRMLRYYNRNRIDSGPNPGMPTTRSYFFTTVFDGSIYAFAGKHGRIYGYQIVAMACKIAEYDALTKTCTGTESPIGSWMTIVTNPKGAPIVASIMPDDDNALTVTKGSSNAVSPFITKSATGGRANISYGMNDKKLGTLADFVADLEATSVGAQQSGVSFEAMQDGSTINFKGRVYVRRGL